MLFFTIGEKKSTQLKNGHRKLETTRKIKKKYECASLIMHKSKLSKKLVTMLRSFLYSSKKGLKTYEMRKQSIIAQQTMSG